VDHTTQGKRKKQFTIDDVAQCCPSTINAVLEKLGIQYAVAGILGYPAGEDVFTIYVVMQDLTTKNTLAVTLTLTRAKEETDGRT